MDQLPGLSKLLSKEESLHTSMDAPTDTETLRASAVVGSLWRHRARMVAASWLLAGGGALAQVGSVACGNPFVNHYGPYDYRSVGKSTLNLVESYHFTPGVETMTRPATTMASDMAADVAYTLEVFPNHHRALLTMMRLAEKHAKDPPPGTRLSVECWFDRAIRFRPDDTVARSLYANYLNSRKRTADAVHQMDVIASNYAKDDPFTHYNLGLLYLDAGEVDKALLQAQQALALGFPRTELKEKLRSLGKWKDPEPAPAGDAGTAAPATAVTP